MGAIFSHTQINPWPEWLKLSAAVTYSGMSRKRLLHLVATEEINGYQDTEDRRGPKGSGAWWIQRISIDQYHERQAGLDAVGNALAGLSAQL